MSSYKTKGIVLRRVNYADADRVITFLTPDDGKVAALAKGVRKLKSKLAGHLEPFNEVELMFVRGKGMEIVVSARVVTPRHALSADYERLRRAFLLCEMCDRLTEKTVERPLYELLNECLDGLIAYDSSLVELYFKLKLLEHLGYRPNLEQCMESHREITSAQRYRFSVEKGGLIEQRLADSTHPKIGEDHIKLWRLILSNQLGQVARVGGVELAAQASLSVCNDFYEYLFGKCFKSEEL